MWPAVCTISLNRFLPLAIVLLVCLIKECKCLKITEFDVPEEAIKGANHFLKCLLDLEQDRLVNLKWYLNDQEFVRFEPRSPKKTQIFPLPVLNVEETNVINSAERGSTVRLEEVNEAMAGKYKCEVTIERQFYTMNREKHMSVVDPVLTTETVSIYHPPQIEEEPAEVSTDERTNSSPRLPLIKFSLLLVLFVRYLI